MEVILLERVEKLGVIGDTVSVRNGYARNYLIPQGKALRATKDNKALFESRKAEIEKENAARRDEAQKLADKVEGTVATIIRQASEDGRLYGSVSARDIAKAVSEAGPEISHQTVRLDDAIKSTGIYDLRVQLHAEVSATIRVNVARSASEAAEALNAEKKAASKEAAKTDAAPAEEVTEEAATEAPAEAAADDKAGEEQAA